MALTLNDVRRIAQNVVTARNPNLHVVSASSGEGGTGYTEILITLEGCSTEPCLLLIGVDRAASEDVFRAAMDDRLRQHLDEHGRPAT